MADRIYAPKVDGAGGMGTETRRWGPAYFTEINAGNSSSTPAGTVFVISDASGTVDDWVTNASTSVRGKVQLATSSESQAGTSTTTAVTPAGLAASAKGLISTNTTIYVRTDGNDSNDGTANDAAHAKLTIAGALSSIAGKLIASGVTVTIQVADGTYTISSTITIGHPDADKIQILGNTSAETTVAIAAIDTTAKTITVAGDYTADIFIGDIFGLTGSSTSGLNGGYVASGVAYSGGNTVITCSAETIASATVGGGSIIIKPCNRCVISTSTTFIILTRSLNQIRGFRVDNASGTSNRAVSSTQGQTGVTNIFSCIFNGVARAVQASCTLSNIIFKNCTDYGMFAATSNVISLSALCIYDGCLTAIAASSNGYVYAISSRVISRNNTNFSSPAVNTFGNGIGYVQY